MNNQEQEKNLYELGYLMPVPEQYEENRESANEKIGHSLDAVKKLIEQHEGSINQEQAPLKRRLAYPISKQKEALFGFLRFNLPASQMAEMQKELKMKNLLLRFVIGKITPKQVEEEQKVPRTRPIQQQTAAPTYTPKPKEQAPEIKSEEFEKKLEELLKE